jgi:hypothetical protein
LGRGGVKSGNVKGTDCAGRLEGCNVRPLPIFDQVLCQQAVHLYNFGYLAGQVIVKRPVLVAQVWARARREYRQVKNDAVFGVKVDNSQERNVARRHVRQNLIALFKVRTVVEPLRDVLVTAVEARSAALGVLGLCHYLVVFNAVQPQVLFREHYAVAGAANVVHCPRKQLCERRI